jgi:hypothetical protein
MTGKLGCYHSVILSGRTEENHEILRVFSYLADIRFGEDELVLLNISL